MEYIDLIRALRARRVERGLLQADVAAPLGCSQGQFSRYENNEQRCPGPVIVRWARELGLAIALDESGAPTEPTAGV